MNKKYYYKTEFMKAAGINSRQRLNQLMKGYENKKGGKVYKVKPTLKKGLDYKKTKCECCGQLTIIFYPSALSKIR